MKKTITLALTLLLLLALSINVLAAPGAFIVSPSGNPAPTLIDATNESHDCTAELIITSYADRGTLPDDAKNAMEDAYDSIASTNDLTGIVPGLSDIAAGMDIAGSALAVSDLFDISYYNCNTHDDHGMFHIKLDAETLANFVALMYWNGESWEIIEGAYIDADGYLNFKTGKFGPYAIVVNTGAGNVEPPKTGDDFPWIYVVLMAASACGLVVVFFLSRKKNA